LPIAGGLGAVFLVACCAGLPALAAGLGGLSVAALLGVGGGALALIGVGAGVVVLVRARRRRACGIDAKRGGPS
jgi:hypothetical protein